MLSGARLCSIASLIAWTSPALDQCLGECCTRVHQHFDEGTRPPRLESAPAAGKRWPSSPPTCPGTGACRVYRSDMKLITRFSAWRCCRGAGWRRRVARHRIRQRRTHRVAVADLADEDDVGRLPHRAAQPRACSVRASEPISPLVDDRLLVAEQELDRVLERQYMACHELVAVIDHRSDRRRLARAGGTDDQDQSAPLHDQVFSTSGRCSSSSWDVVRDEAHHRRDRTALQEGDKRKLPIACTGRPMLSSRASSSSRKCASVRRSASSETIDCGARQVPG